MLLLMNYFSTLFELSKMRSDSNPKVDIEVLTKFTFKIIFDFIY